MVECRDAWSGFLLSHVQTFVVATPAFGTFPPLATPSILQLAGAIACLALLYLVAARLTGAGIVDDSYIFLSAAATSGPAPAPVLSIPGYVEGYIPSPLWLACATLIQGDWPAPPQVLALASATTGILTIALVGLANPVSSWAAGLLAAAFVASSTGLRAAGRRRGWSTPLFRPAADRFGPLVRETVALRRLVAGAWRASGAHSAVPDWRPSRSSGSWSFVLWRSDRRPLSRAAVEDRRCPAACSSARTSWWRHAYYGQWLPQYIHREGRDSTIRPPRRGRTPTLQPPRNRPLRRSSLWRLPHPARFEAVAFFRSRRPP